MEPLKLLEYNRWANSLILDQAETLTQQILEKEFGGSFGSIRATLIHVLESDWLWLKRFQGVPLADIPAWKVHSASDIKKVWIPIQNEMVDMAKQFSTEPKKPIEFKTRKGQPFVMPFSEIVTHISHHGSYHRGQITNMIRSAGEKPVSTDYFIFSVSHQ
ncbi:MAG TPA: DinB family protein [Chryseosolibacter sp.]